MVYLPVWVDSFAPEGKRTRWIAYSQLGSIGGREAVDRWLCVRTLVSSGHTRLVSLTPRVASVHADRAQDEGDVFPACTREGYQVNL